MSQARIRQVAESPRMNAQRKRETFQTYLSVIGEKEADVMDVPGAVREAFAGRYPGGEVIGYIRLGRGRFGVYFLDKVWHKFACFTTAGEWEETRVSSLAKEARERALRVAGKAMRKKDYDLLLLERVLTAGGSKHWEVLLDTEQGSSRLVFDDNERLMGRYDDATEDDDAPVSDDLDDVDSDDDDTEDEGFEEADGGDDDDEED